MLGLPKNADSEAILRAYRKKLRDNRGNDAALERFEAAHTAILMRGLSSRLAVRALPLFSIASACLGGATMPQLKRLSCNSRRAGHPSPLTSSTQTALCTFPGGPGVRGCLAAPG